MFKQRPRHSFMIARLVAIGDEWMLSGPVQVLRASEQGTVVEFFGTDLLVVPGEQVQERLDGYYTYCRDAVLGPETKDSPPAVSMSLPLDLTDAETVALIYDETAGLGFYAEFGLVEEAFANPDLLRPRRWREQTLSYVEDDSVEPMVLRRLADRDPEKATGRLPAAAETATLRLEPGW